MAKIITFTLIIIFFFITQIILLYGNTNKNKNTEANKETNIETNLEADIKSDQNAKEEPDIESNKATEKETDLEKDKEAELKTNKITDLLETNKETMMQSKIETDLEIIKDSIQETNKKTVAETNKITDLDSNKKEDIETNKITDLEANKETNIKTSKETDLDTSNKENYLNTNKETILETIKESNKETDKETNEEANKEEALETNKETNFETHKEEDLQTNKETNVKSYKEDDIETNIETSQKTDLEPSQITNGITDLEASQSINGITYQEASQGINGITDLEANQSINKITDIEASQGINRITDLETDMQANQKTDLEINQDTIKETDFETNKKTNLETNQETNKDLETNLETDLETNQYTNKETYLETNRETALETDIETETLECQFNMTCVYFRDENNNYIKYKKDTYIYSSTTLPLSLHLEFKDQDLNKMNIDGNQIIVENATMHGNRMRLLNWTISKSPDLYDIYIDLDESNKEIFEHLTSRIYDFTFKVKKDNEGTIINLKVNHIDTTTDLFKSLEVRDWIEQKNDNIAYSYANVTTQVGYYFNHDDDIHALGDKGGFNPEQVMEIEIFDILKIGIKAKNNTIDKNMINFGKATPKRVYNSRSHDGKSTIEDFKYQIPLMYGVDPLVDSNNNTIYATVYIGLKGDAKLDKVVDGGDLVPVYGIRKSSHIPRQNEICFSSDDIGITSLSNFLIDVTEDEYGAYNWNKTERIIDEEDGELISKFIQEKEKNSNIPDKDIWNKVKEEKDLEDNR